MKTKGIIVGIILLLVGLGVYGFSGLSAGGEGASVEASKPLKISAGVIEIEENNINVGDIPIEGGKIEVRYSFRNTGSEPVTLKQGETSCMCTEAVVERENGEVTPRIKMQGHGSTGVLSMTIEPGEVATLVGIYDPMAHGPKGIGPIKRDIFLKTNSQTTPQVQFSFSGVVVST